MNPAGGAAKAVYIVQPSEYRENGGPYQTEGGIAIPVYGYTSLPTDRAVEGGPALPIRVLTDADLVQNGGQYRLEGRPTAMPIYEVAQGERAIQGGPAIPVYSINYIPPSPDLYLFRDEFTTNQAAPLPITRDAEPGPGSWTFVQTDGSLSIVGQQLIFPTQATPVWGDQGGYTNDLFPRLTGRAIMATYTRNSAAAGTSFVGWLASAAVAIANIEGRAMLFVGSGGPNISGLNAASNGPGLTQNPFSAGVAYQIALVLRSTGMWLLAKGGAFANWTLLLFADEGSTASLRIGFSNLNSTGAIDNVRIVDLPAPWTSDYAIMALRQPSVSSGDTAVGLANGWACVDWQTVAGETMELSFRRIDDNNRLIVRCIKNSNLIRTIKVEGGVETQLDSDAQTWTTGTTYKVIALFDGNNISTFVRTGNTWASRNSTSSTFNTSATGLKVAGATTLSNLECYPRDVNAFMPVVI